MSVEQTVTCDNCGRTGAIENVVWSRPKASEPGEYRDLCASCLADVRARCGIR